MAPKKKIETDSSESEYPISSGEDVLMDGRIHNAVFYTPIGYALVAILVGVFFHPFMGVFVMILNLYPIYRSTVLYLTTRLILTDKKVMGKTGFLTRDWTQLKLSKIETANLEEPILGRMLGFSTVNVTGTGTGSISFPFIIDGNKFIRRLEGLLDERED